jgi:transposase
MKAYQEVPGLGPILAARFVAEIQTPHRFRDKRKVWQASRLGIRDQSSDGKLIAFKRLDRQAGGTLKAISRMVFERAIRCRDENLFQRTYKRSLERTRNPVHARLNTERKILAVMWAMWRDGTEYKDDIDQNRA